MELNKLNYLLVLPSKSVVDLFRLYTEQSKKRFQLCNESHDITCFDLPQVSSKTEKSIPLPPHFIPTDPPRHCYTENKLTFIDIESKKITFGITEKEIKRPMTVATTKRWLGGGTKYFNNFVCVNQSLGSFYKTQTKLTDIRAFCKSTVYSPVI